VCDDSPSTSTLSTRSSLPAFDFKRDCIFCNKEASFKTETKKSQKYRRSIHEVATLEIRSTIIAKAKNRADGWEESVLAKLNSVVDLVAAEAKYHRD